MKRFNPFLLVISIIVSSFGLSFCTTSAASPDYVTANKSVSPSSILTGEEVEVTINIQGTPR